MPPDPLDRPGTEGTARSAIAALTDHRLLSAEEEATLIEVMLAGAHAHAALATAPPAARPATQEQAERGEQARATLVRHNLRLVVSLAKRHLPAAGPHLTLEDLVSFGCVGLLRGLDRFDPEKGRRLSTYVTWWVRQAINRGIAEEGRVIDLPVHVHERLGRQRRAAGRLAQSLGREPTAGELAAELGWRPEQVTRLEAAARETLSLNARLGEAEEGSELGDLLPDGRYDPEHDALEGALQADISQAMERLLTERERQFVRAHFGFDSGQKVTLDVIGQHAGLTRERVRQVIVGALEKLRENRIVQAYGALLRDV